MRSSAVMKVLHDRSHCVTNRKFVMEAVESETSKPSTPNSKPMTVPPAQKYKHSNVTSPVWQRREASNDNGCYRQIPDNSNTIGNSRVNIQNYPPDNKYGRRTDTPNSSYNTPPGPVVRPSSQHHSAPGDYRWRLGKVTSTYQTFSPVVNKHSTSVSPPKPSSPPDLPDQEMWTSPPTPKFPSKPVEPSQIPTPDHQMLQQLFPDKQSAPADYSTPVSIASSLYEYSYFSVYVW